jgi:hypothetical protein
MQLLIKIIVVCGAIFVSLGTAIAAEETANLGQDATRPRSRFDLRIKHQKFPNDLELTKLTTRVDHPIVLSNGWKLNTRISQGFFFSDLPSTDNFDRETEVGFGDLLTQAFFIPPSRGNTSFGFGLRTIFPTATQDQFGTGKYRLVPIGVVLHFPSWLPPGSFVGLGVRNEIGFAGDDDRDDIHELQIVPLVNIRLSGKSFIGFFPTIRRDWKNNNDFFFPFDMEIGRAIGRGKVGSLRFQTPMIDSRDRYDWSLEARVTFLF